MYKETIKQLHYALKEERLSIFVGAGISKSSEGDGIKFPVWDDLISSFQSELNLSDEQDYLKLAQLYYLEFGEFLYYKKLKSFFNNDASPSPVHQLIFSLEPQNIITTNWDCLLEKSALQNLNLLDVIVSDQDLAKSSIPRKLIKMHGDFEHHNIVFKEDDYLNYEFNFPLISNFVKGVLSTNAILFLGYSYNDIDLKLIMMWLRNNAKTRQPMYLVTFYENRSQIKYLENQGIKVVVLPEINELFDRLDEFSSKVAWFLKDILNFNENNSKSTISTFSVYNKLKHLEDYKYILYEQVSSALSNCGYVFGEGISILQFYKELLTYDYEKETREQYGNFVNKLNEIVDNNHQIDCNLARILSILGKSGIDGISLSQDESNCTYIKTFESEYNKELNDLLSFDVFHTQPNFDNLDDMLFHAHSLYLYENYDDSLSIIKIALRLAISRKLYSKVLILSYNYENLKEIINRNKELHSNSLNGKEEQKPDVFSNLDDYYNSIPYKDKLSNKPLFNTLSSNFFKERTYGIFSSLRKAEEYRSTIKSGGIFYDRDIERTRNEHSNFLRYFFGNNLMVQHFLSFKDVNKYYIECSFNSQCQKEKINLNRDEIYSIITCFKNKDLKMLISKFSVVDNELKDFIDISSADIQWFSKNLLPNLVNSRRTVDSYKSKFNLYIENAIELISFAKLTKDEFDCVLKAINDVIDGTGVSIGFYEAVNRFLAIQYKLFDLDFDKEKYRNILESLIRKFSERRASGYERIAVQDHYIGNFFNLAIENDIKVTNTKDVERLIFEIKDSTLENKCQIASSLFVSILNVSDENVTKVIKEFFNELASSIKENPTIDGLIFYLTLVSHDFSEYEEEALRMLVNTLENSSLSINDLVYFSRVETLTNYLAINKGISSYKDVFESYLNKIEVQKKATEEKVKASMQKK
ncbi:SIR2 family protein [Vibrio parahaemolyticus]|nr:hypothetical protein [Vibrio parahaemolyticus]EIR4240869.1 SIR2 family protein [Vibrio parahaemolyticus]ELA7006359.1 SIR2 family protein [Vibrio parahaemolyticus]ELA7007421.1 SIR2 family protein [Vibrio parahaemolyticus]